jgi:fructokinase
MILVCGEALIDLLVGAPREHGLSVSAVAGGSPFNVAIALARLDRPAAFLASLADDAFGDFLLQRLTAEGVGTAFVRRTMAQTTLSVVTTDKAGHPRYSFYAESGAERALAITDLPSVLPAEVKAIVAGSYALAVEPVASTIETLLRNQGGRRLISLDPNVRPHVIGDLAGFRTRFEGLLDVATIVKASAEDLALFYGPCDVVDVARNWLARGPRLVVITRGADRPIAVMSDALIEGTSHEIDIADTVGAGDTFHAALLANLDEAGLLSPESIARARMEHLRDALDFATAAAAIVCTRCGADSPRRADVASFLQHPTTRSDHP